MLPERMRALFLVYFITHIPATLLIDGQAALGPSVYPEILRRLLQWHIDTNKDPLMDTQPVWFKSLIWMEVLLQFPFMFVAIYALVNRRNWIRIPALIYGVQCSTTLVPILGELLSNEKLDQGEKAKLASMYVPYLIVPMMLAAAMARNQTPFGKAKRR